MPDEGLVGEDLLERGPHGGHRQRVAGERAADAAGVDEVEALLGEHRSASAWLTPYAPAGMPAGDGLADRDDVGLEIPGLRAPPGPAENVCVSSLISSVAVAPGELAHPFEVAGLGQHDADVGERRLHQHRRDVAVGELALERLEIVELRHP